MPDLYTVPETRTIQYRPRAWNIRTANPRNSARVTQFQTEIVQIIDGIEQDNAVNADPVEVVIPSDPMAVLTDPVSNEVITIVDPFTGETVSAKLYQIALMYEKFYCDKYKAAHPERQWAE